MSSVEPVWFALGASKIEGVGLFRTTPQTAPVVPGTFFGHIAVLPERRAFIASLAELY